MAGLPRCLRWWSSASSPPSRPELGRAAREEGGTGLIAARWSPATLARPPSSKPLALRLCRSVHRPSPRQNATFLAGRAANHVLDDLLLNAHLPPPDVARLFAGMRLGEPCSMALVQAWHDLLDAPACLERLAARVARDMFDYIQASQTKLVVLHQYRSGHHVHRGLEAIHPRCMRVMRLLRDHLSAEPVAARRVLLRRGRSAGWLVARPHPRVGTGPGAPRSPLGRSWWGRR